MSTLQLLRLLGPAMKDSDNYDNGEALWNNKQSYASRLAEEPKM